MESVKSFENKDDALIEAQEWTAEMNETFCQKHHFSIVEVRYDLIIKVDGIKGYYPFKTFKASGFTFLITIFFDQIASFKSSI